MTFIGSHRDESNSDGDKRVGSVEILQQVSGQYAVTVGEITPWDTKKAAELIFALNLKPDDKLLKSVPYSVQKNVVFAIDLKSLPSRGDIVSDSNGRWQQSHGTREASFEYDDEFEMVIPKLKGTGVLFTRASWTNHSCPNYKRIIVSSSELGIAVLQYYFKEAQEQPFKVLPHGNSKSNMPHDRLRDSTKMKVDELQKAGKKPMEIRDIIIKDNGGLLNLNSTAVIPSKKAIYNRAAVNKPTALEDFYGLILRCNEEHDTSQRFIRQIEVAPSYRVMIANERQLNDLSRFGIPFGFSLDTTFNIGDYLVTVVIIRHKLLERRLNGTTPVIIGPIFIHTFKDADTYRWMAAQILHARPEMRHVRVFGSDGDMVSFRGSLRSCNASHEYNCDILPSSSIQSVFDYDCRLSTKVFIPFSLWRNTFCVWYILLITW